METGTADLKAKTVTQKVGHVEKTPAKKKRVLIIEDEYSASKFLTMRLKNLGFIVSAAFDGMAGLKEATETIPDLIILDLMLPKMDGYKVCGLLKNDARYSKIPIIMFTARVQEEDERLGKDLGAEEYVTKPFDPKLLLSKIKELLGE